MTDRLSCWNVGFALAALFCLWQAVSQTYVIITNRAPVSATLEELRQGSSAAWVTFDTGDLEPVEFKAAGHKDELQRLMVSYRRRGSTGPAPLVVIIESGEAFNLARVGYRKYGSHRERFVGQMQSNLMQQPTFQGLVGGRSAKVKVDQASFSRLDTPFAVIYKDARPSQTQTAIWLAVGLLLAWSAQHARKDGR